MAGKIISLVAVLLAVVPVAVFFAARKSPILAAVCVVAVLIYTGFYVLSWYIEGMELGLGAADLAMTALIVAVLIVHQNDIKSGFFKLGKRANKSRSATFSDEELQVCVGEIVRACQTMSKSRTGALIVIVPTAVPEYILKSGTLLGALLSAPLLESIFNTGGPMHDGAVIVEGNKVAAAGCFLPLSQSRNIGKDVGTRHRAAIGITEDNDNLGIVISEENGIISITKDGALKRYITPERLSDILYQTFGVSAAFKYGGR